MPIINIFKDFTEEIKKGEMLFRITAFNIDDLSFERGEDYTPLLSYENVQHLTLIHRYMPLLYIIELPKLIAYLYDCLNREMLSPRDKRFIIYVRKISEREESIWFSVEPYNDNL